MSAPEVEVFPWSVEETEEAMRCRVFSVERRRMREGSGGEPPREADFFVVRSPDWINVVALTVHDELVMIEQWRHGVQRVTLEIPGGMVDPGEQPFAAARRELKEETGFVSDRWFYLGTVEPNPAIQDNRCHTYLAVDARADGAPQFDSTERCRLVLAPYAEVPNRLAAGEITHALVQVALLHEQLRRSGVLTAQPERT